LLVVSGCNYHRWPAMMEFFLSGSLPLIEFVICDVMSYMANKLLSLSLLITSGDCYLSMLVASLSTMFCFTSRLQRTWTTSNSGGRPGWWRQSRLQLGQCGQLTAIEQRRIQQLKLIVHQTSWTWPWLFQVPSQLRQAVHLRQLVPEPPQQVPSAQ